MSVLSSPGIVTNGLIFNYDINNRNSYRSPPLRNVLTEITPRGQGDSATYKFSNGTESVYIPSLGFIPNCAYMDMYNDYNGGSGNCCPSPFGYGNGLSVSGSTQYTYAIVYKSINRYTNANWMYHYEYNSVGTYLTEFGVHLVGGYSGVETHLGDDWYWSRAIFTTQSTAATINTGSWMYEYARYNRFYVAKVMIVQGNYLNLHPKFWPALGTTISSTQSLIDNVGAKTIELTNVNNATFNTDYNAITLDGNNQYIYAYGDNYWNAWSQNGVNGNSELTIELIFNSSDTGGYIISRPWNGSGQYNYTMYNTGFGLHIGSSSAAIGYSNICTGTTVHMVYWMSATQYGVYRNGEVYVSAQNHGLTGGGASSGTNNFGTLFGSLYPYGQGWGGNTGFSINGKFYHAKIYNRVLTANEIKQNFNATRGRYGV